MLSASNAEGPLASGGQQPRESAGEALPATPADEQQPAVAREVDAQPAPIPGSVSEQQTDPSPVARRIDASSARQARPSGLQGPADSAAFESTGDTGVNSSRAARPARQQGLRSPPADLPEPELGSNARLVLEQRYLLRDGAGRVIETPREMFWRVASAVAAAELEFPGGQAALCHEQARRFYSAMARRQFLPSSPILHNAGTEQPLLAACVVLPMEDSSAGLQSILRQAAVLHRGGAGTGFDFSGVRPRGERLGSSSGTEGPLRCIEACSAATMVVPPGGYRPAANWAGLRIDHPDILQFVRAKQAPGVLQNFNFSVAVTERFLQQLRRTPEQPHQVRYPEGGSERPLVDQQGHVWSVGALWREIARCAHWNGEPGLFFVDRANAGEPLAHLGPIRATNPCGEQLLHAYDACHLGSINLASLVGTAEAAGDFDWLGLERLARLGVRFLDNAIEVAWWPLAELEHRVRATRRIGLGVMGLADTLFLLGLPYNSAEACVFGGRVMQVLSQAARQASAELAEVRGNFGAYEGSGFWAAGKPMRNSHVTSVAPTGTLSLLAGCSPGLEPVFALALERHLPGAAGGVAQGQVEVNPILEQVVRRAGLWTPRLAEELRLHGHLGHSPELPRSLREVFVTAAEIAPEWHLRMQAAFQAHCDSGVAKTINLPARASVATVEAAFELASRLGLVGVTCYRDGSRPGQPLGRAEAQYLPNQDLAAQDLLPPQAQAPAVPLTLRLRQELPGSTLWVEIAVEPGSGHEQALHLRLEPASATAAAELSPLEALINRLLRQGDSLAGLLECLGPAAPTTAVTTLAPALGLALRRYVEARERLGLETLLGAGANPQAALPRRPGESGTQPAASAGPRGFCPLCAAPMASIAGCVSCVSCGWSGC